MSKQRDNCQQCLAPVLRVFVGSRRTLLDWPWAEHGDVAVYATVAGTYSARHCPVGEALHAAEKRYRVHACGEPKPDLSEPTRAAEPVPADQVTGWQEGSGDAFLKRWQAARSAAAKADRNQRVQRPGKPITGIRVPPPQMENRP